MKSVAVQFYLPREFFEKLEKENISTQDTLCHIDNIFRKNSFEQEINGLYLSSKSNAVSAIITAQQLNKEIPYFETFVKNFKLYHINDIDPLVNIKI